NGKALAELPGLKIGTGEAEPNGHSQALIVRLVGAPNRLQERIKRFDSPDCVQPEVAEAVQDLAENVRVAAPGRELPSFSEQRGRLVLQIAQTSEVRHDLGAHGCSLGEVLRRRRERV